jgi:hypothetical protein
LAAVAVPSLRLPALRAILNLRKSHATASRRATGRERDGREARPVSTLPPHPAGPPRRGLPFARMPRSLAGMRQRMSRDTARFVWLTILPVGVALVSLVISLYSLLLTHHPPEVVMTMPDRVRVVQEGNVAYLYLQPRFVNTGDNQRNEIISGLVAEVQPVAGGEPATFVWDEQGAWLFDHASRSLTWQFVADPGPLVVGPNDPQLPICLFLSAPGWMWQPGGYRVIVTAERTIHDEPLRARLEFALDQDTVDVISNQSGTFLTISAATPAP